MLTLTASIIETVIVRSSVFAGQQLLNVAYYGSLTLYNWYNPTFTETEKLQMQVNLLQCELNELKAHQYKNVENSIIAFNDFDDIDEFDDKSPTDDKNN